MSPPSINSGYRAAIRLGWFAGSIMLGHVLLMLFPAVPEKLGMVMMDHPYLDSHAILAAGDAARAGMDPWRPNPLDTFGRPHCYSSWWLVTGQLGLSRADNTWIGPLWQVSFLAAAVIVLRPMTVRGMIVAATALFSPPVILGVSRANNDLLIFTVLVAGLLALASGRRYPTAAFATSVVLATGLKFYPLAAAAALLSLRPRRHAIAALIITLGLAGAALLTTQMDRALAAAPSPLGIMTFGHQTAMRMAGLEGPAARAVALMVIPALGLLWLARGWAPRFSRKEHPGLPEAAFLAGAAILVVCFLAAGSYAYRLIFILLTLPHLASPNSGPAGKATLALLITVMWMDGIFEWVTGTWLEGAGAGIINAFVEIWLVASQSIAWLTVSLLAAGLLEYGRSFLKADTETPCASRV